MPVRPAGTRRRAGSYRQGTVHALVAARLAEYAERLRADEVADSPSATAARPAEDGSAADTVAVELT